MSELATRDELLRAIPILELKWEVQNDKKDVDTGFIYYCQRIEQVFSLASSNNVDFAYALHRWFNYQCSKTVENIFCQFGAKHYEDEKNHDIDIIIDDIPFDIKLSVISKNYKGNTNLYNRENKNKYMVWLKENASQEGRKHTKNKIYVICKTNKDKTNFQLIESTVFKFLQFFVSNKQKYNFSENREVCELLYIAEDEK